MRVLKSNKAVDSLLQKRKFIGIDKRTTDSLEPIFNKASFYLEILKNQLDSADSEGEKLDVAEKLIIKTTQGDSLYKYVMTMYDVGIKYGDSSFQRSYTVFKEPTKDKWLRKYFRMIPTVAAKTILSKFQNDLAIIKFAVGSAGNKEK